MTVAQKRSLCKSKNLVYDTKTKDCRVSKVKKSVAKSKVKNLKKKYNKEVKSKQRKARQFKKMYCDDIGKVYNTRSKMCKASPRKRSVTMTKVKVAKKVYDNKQDKLKRSIAKYKANVAKAEAAKKKVMMTDKKAKMIL